MDKEEKLKKEIALLNAYNETEKWLSNIKDYITGAEVGLERCRHRLNEIRFNKSSLSIGLLFSDIIGEIEDLIIDSNLKIAPILMKNIIENKVT